MERGQNASRGEPVCSSSGSVTCTSSRSTRAREVERATVRTNEPARDYKDSQPVIRRASRTSRVPPAGTLNRRAPEASVTRRCRNSRGW